MPDEPTFTLRGRDKLAPILVRFWARWWKFMGQLKEEQVKEAMKKAMEMENYRQERALGPHDKQERNS